MLTAIKWFKKAWKELPATLIQNCWRHTGLLGGPSSALNDTLEPEVLRDLMDQSAFCAIPSAVEYF